MFRRKINIKKERPKFMEAVKSGDGGHINEFLKKHSHDKNWEEKLSDPVTQATPLMQALQVKQMGVVTSLCTHRVDLNKVDVNGDTALVYAARYMDANALEFTLGQIMNKREEYHRRSTIQLTADKAFFAAAENNEEDNIEYLLQFASFGWGLHLNLPTEWPITYPCQKEMLVAMAHRHGIDFVNQQIANSNRKIIVTDSSLEPYKLITTNDLTHAPTSPSQSSTASITRAISTSSNSASVSSSPSSVTLPPPLTYQQRLDTLDPDITIPEQFRCPISLLIMTNPVAVSSGRSYDRQSLVDYFKSKNNPSQLQCPVNRDNIQRTELTNKTNINLRNAIEAFVQE